MRKYNIKTTEEDKLPFDKIFKNYRHLLIFIARKLLNDQLVAEDIVTEVFIKYWDRRNGFSNETSVKSFLIISVRNACLNHLKQSKRNHKQMNFLLEGLKDEEESVLSKIIEADNIEQAWQIVESLPPECRRIFLFGYIKGIHDSEIANCLSLSQNTVRNQKIRGLQLIKKRYDNVNNI